MGICNGGGIRISFGANIVHNCQCVFFMRPKASLNFVPSNVLLASLAITDVDSMSAWIVCWWLLVVVCSRARRRVWSSSSSWGTLKFSNTAFGNARHNAKSCIVRVREAGM